MRVGQDERALSQVGQEHGREHDPEPGAADRLRAEVTAIGVQRLSPGQSQHHAAEREEGVKAVVDHEAGTPDR